MCRQWASAVTLACAGTFVLSPSIASAEEKAEGKVVATKLTACDLDKGRCEGYLTLEPQGISKTERVNIRVVGDTSITKDGSRAYLPALRGNVVAVTYVKNKEDNLAKSIEVLQGRK